MGDNARFKAFSLLDDIITNGKYANLTLKSSLGGFDERDRAFICALVYGTLDKLIALDYVILLFAKGRIQPKIRNILRLGAYQIIYMDRVPDSAAVNTSVELAQSVGKGMLKGYINGVLRSISRGKSNIKYPQEPVKRIAYKYSYPEFIVRELISELGEKEAESFCAYEGEHKTVLRVDRSKALTEDIRQKLGGEKSRFFDDCFYLPGEPSMLENGICSVQGEASMAAVRALDPQKGEKILDACAAPGGKTVYIASLMQNGSVTALEKYAHRTELIKKNAERCGYAYMIEAVCADAAEIKLTEEYDRVLADVPCSGLGVLEQKPEIKNTITADALKEIEDIQSKILDNISRYVKKGGVLVYSTCTVRKRENIMQVEKFLKNNADFSLDSLENVFGGIWGDEHDMSKGYIALYPHKDRTDGFFIARMKRN